MNRKNKRKYFLIIPGVAILLVIVFILVFFYAHTGVTSNLDSYVYGLPYEKGERYRVVQGYGGLFSHQHTAAIDFAMPQGTRVCAARGGVIYAYRDNSNEGGIWASYKNMANFIIIQHDDGSFGCYWHLQKNGVLVKSGKVVAGQVIGFSGATGQVIRPHLHFSVKRVLNYEEDSFVRTLFSTTGGIQLLKNRRAYQRPH